MFERPVSSNQNPIKPISEQKNSISNQTTNQAPAEDIFDRTDKVAFPQDPSSTKVKEIENEITRSIESNPKKLKWFLLTILILFLAFLGYFIFGKVGNFSFESLNIRFITSKDDTNIEEEQSVPQNIDQTQNTQTTDLEVIDSDKDGLSDNEEKALNTDRYNPDSDLDGLSDMAEVRVYLTNPLNLDTDGDTYSDGQEVANGFDPKNSTPGSKLQDIQKEIQKLK